MSDCTSQKISNMCFACAILVVLLHIFPGTSASASVWYVDKFVAFGVGRIAVPFFFIVSGYFIGRHVVEARWWEFEMKKRVRTLLIPYFVWNALFAIMLIMITLLRNCPVPLDIWCVVGVDPFSYPANGVLWYIRSLFVFLSISKLLVWCLRKTGYLLLAGLFVAYLLLFDPHDITRTARFFVVFFYLEGLFYYVIGLTIPVRGLRRIVYSRGSLILMLLLGVMSTLAMLHLYRIGSMSLLFNYMRVVVIPLFLVPMWVLMPSYEIPKCLSRSTFAIFVMHPFVIYMFKCVSRGCVDYVIGYFLCFSMSVIVYIGISNILRKLTPRVAAVVYGGR